LIIAKPPAGSLSLRTQSPVVRVTLFGVSHPLPQMYSDYVAELIVEYARGPPGNGSSHVNANGYQSSAPIAVLRGELL